MYCSSKIDVSASVPFDDVLFLLVGSAKGLQLSRRRSFLNNLAGCAGGALVLTDGDTAWADGNYGSAAKQVGGPRDPRNLKQTPFQIVAAHSPPRKGKS